MFKTFISALAIFSANVQAFGFGGLSKSRNGRGQFKGMGDQVLGDIFSGSSLGSGFGNSLDMD